MPGGLKEIKRRLASVKNTKKITYAMKLVSAAKLRRAQESVTSAKEYTDTLNDLFGKLLSQLDVDQLSHPLLEQRSEIKKVGLVVLGGSRGLCGGYNSNLNKAVKSFVREQRERTGNEVYSLVLGRKPAEYFRKVNFPYKRSYEGLPEDANLWPINEVAVDLELNFLKGQLDEVWVIYTEFRSALSVNVRVEKLLPLNVDLRAASGEEEEEQGGIPLIEPSSSVVFAAVLPRVFQAKIRQGALDSKASEHGSRMTAMESATKNAGELIRKLQLQHNRLRQAGITSELLDIIGGANAVE